MNLKNNQSGFAHVIAIGAIVLILVAVGFAGYRAFNSNNTKQLSTTKQISDAGDRLPQDLNGILEISKVKELAIGSSTASVSNLELENEHGELVYKVTLSDGTVVVLDAKTGAVITNADDTTEAEDEQDILPADFAITTSFDKAREIAQQKFPSGIIKKIALDVEAGKVVLSVRFADKSRVDIDANTGAIIRIKDPKVTKPTQDSVAQPTAPSNPTSGGSSSGSGSSSNNSGSGSTNSGSSQSGGGSVSTDDDNEIDDDDNGTDLDDDSNDDSSGSNSGSGNRH